MSERPIEISQALVDKWTAGGKRIGLWTEYSHTIPKVIVWEAENEKPQNLMKVQQVFQYEGRLNLISGHNTRIPKDEVLEFDLETVNAMVRLEQQRWDLDQQRETLIRSRAPIWADRRPCPVCGNTTNGGAYRTATGWHCYSCKQDIPATSPSPERTR